MTEKTYRSGAVGALLDLYEHASNHLIQHIRSIPPGEFGEVLDAETKDDDCRSVQAILNHVVRAGYGYVGYIKKTFELPGRRPEIAPLTADNAVSQLTDMLEYSIAGVEPMCDWSYDRFEDVRIKTRWGGDFDFEQLMEHAIVHVLRHHRQIERLRAIRAKRA